MTRAALHVFLMRRVFPLLLVLSACGASREAVLSRVQMGIAAVRSVAVEEDERIQRQILAEAKASNRSPAEVDAALAAHRKVRDLATKAYQAALLALATAALEPGDASVARAIELAAAYQKALAAMGVHL